MGIQGLFPSQQGGVCALHTEFPYGDTGRRSKGNHEIAYKQGMRREVGGIQG